VNLQIREILAAAREQGASDIHLLPGRPLALRISREIHLNGERIDGAAIAAFLAATLDGPASAKLRKFGAVDVGLHFPESGPIRLHAFHEHGGPGACIRLLHREIPTFESLGLPHVFHSFAQLSSGLVLIVGPTGSGKSSALAATIHAINEKHARHIHVIEDTLEYEHAPINSIISSVEIGIGKNAPSFGAAVNAALRKDANVIVVGEARDYDAMQAVITAADSGHFVLATIHTEQTTTACERIVRDSKPPEQERIRSELASVLVAVVGLRLVAQRGKKNGVVVASEVLRVNDQIREHLRKNETRQLRTLMENDPEMHTLEQDLNRLVAAGAIYADDARVAARYPEEIRG
jgi:twitching motility protein PilT